MPWFQPDAEPGSDDEIILAGAVQSLSFVRLLRNDEAVRIIKLKVDHPLIEDCVRHYGDKCITPLGRYDIIGPDGETPWPSACFRVTLEPWKYDQKRESWTVAIYRDPDDGGSRAVAGYLDDSWYKGPLTPGHHEERD